MSEREPPADAAADPEPQDVVLVHARNPERGSYGIVRWRDNRVELGEMRPVKEGQPLQGEVVRLHEREAPLYDVEVLLDAPAPHARGAGPPKVTSNDYRTGWDGIFGPRDDDTSTLPN